jgi:hypothetical protein
MVNSPGFCEADALPQVFGVTMPRSIKPFVGKPVIASQEKSDLRDAQDTYPTLTRTVSAYFTTGSITPNAPHIPPS